MIRRSVVLTATVWAVGVTGFIGATAHQDLTDRPAVQGAECVQDFPTAAAPDPRATVVMCGLDNPRGLTFSQFALYVAEAGRGGLGLTAPEFFQGQVGAIRYYGATGAVSRLLNGIQEQIATGFPSHATVLGRNAIGPNDVAATASTDLPTDVSSPGASPDCVGGCVYVAVGLQQPPSYRTLYPFLADFAKLARITADFQWTFVSDLGDYETQYDPDQVFLSPPELDTNPYALLNEPGRGVLVADAGGNSLLRVSPAGGISTVAVFPPNIYPSAVDDAVPTAVTVGPDGAYYVSELTGFPLVPGAANILRVSQRGDVDSACITGFTQIMDLAFDDTGVLYVLNFAGTVVRISPDRTAASAGAQSRGTCARYGAGERTTVVTGLNQPTSMTVGPDGALYISNRGTFAGTGQVIRIQVGDQ